MPFDHPGGPLGFVCGQRVLDRLVGLTVGIVPSRCAPVQLPDLVRRSPLQTNTQQVGKKVVVAPPPTDIVESNKEQIRAFCLLEQRLAIGAPRNRVTQRTRELFQQRGLHEEVANIRRLTMENLLGEVVKDETMAAGERVHERCDVAVPLHRKPSQLQSCRPTLCSRCQGLRCIIGEVGSGRLAEERCCFVRGEAELVLSQLSQLTPRPRWVSNKGGSARLINPMCRPGGACSSRKLIDACTTCSSITW